MYDKELVQEILTQILKSADTILYRFRPVKKVQDFTDSQADKNIFLLYRL